ncbi:MAG: hypothetical protein WDZ88_03820 [Candidatus Paceibacterota bacterium]
MRLIQKTLLISTGLFVVVVIGLLVYFENNKEFEPTISIDDVEIRNEYLKLREFPYWTFVGEAKNNSSTTVDSLSFKIRAYDCPTDTVGPDCEIIGEEVVNTYVTIPEGQVRRFVDMVTFTDMPVPKNEFKWAYELINIGL